MKAKIKAFCMNLKFHHKILLTHAILAPRENAKMLTHNVDIIWRVRPVHDFFIYRLLTENFKVKKKIKRNNRRKQIAYCVINVIISGTFLKLSLHLQVYSIPLIS